MVGIIGCPFVLLIAAFGVSMAGAASFVV